MTDRMSGWLERMHWPRAGEAALGFGYEWWDLDPTHYEGHEELRQRLKDLHRKTTKRQLAYRLADNLLNDLLVVVGGVESSFQRLVALRDEVQASSDEHVRPEMEPGVPQGLGHPKVTEAWYEFANVLFWTRGVEERLSRKPFGRRYRGLRDQGLVPALHPKRLRKRVIRLHDDLIAGPVGEVREFANMSLHAALVRHPYSGAEVEESTGRVTLPLPDRAPHPVYHRDLLTWADGRDAFTSAEELWRSIETFMDGLLDAFERSIPADCGGRSSKRLATDLRRAATRRPSKPGRLADHLSTKATSQRLTRSTPYALFNAAVPVNAAVPGMSGGLPGPGELASEAQELAGLGPGPGSPMRARASARGPRCEPTVRQHASCECD